ncbi:MAG: hypothetical protein Q7S21_05005 [archaeon]|nr:hypothetical protein [archaeon]
MPARKSVKNRQRNILLPQDVKKKMEDEAIRKARANIKYNEGNKAFWPAFEILQKAKRHPYPKGYSSVSSEYRGMDHPVIKAQEESDKRGYIRDEIREYGSRKADLARKEASTFTSRPREFKKKKKARK